jgi:hypothetical protein
MWVTVAVAAALMMAATVAGVVWLGAGRPPLAGPSSGYDPPQTMILVSDDGTTLRFGYVACVQYDAPQTIERPDSVTLRVHWRGADGCAPPGASVAMAELTLNYQVTLAAPLGSRRLVGPDGEALPWVGQAALLGFPGPPVPGQHRNPASAPPPRPAGIPLPLPGYEPLLPGAKCLQTQDPLPQYGLDRTKLEQCGYGKGRRAVLPPAGTLVTVRGRTAHLLQGDEHTAPPLARYEIPWRLLWWTQGATIVILASERWLPSAPPPLPAASLVALASTLN